MLDALLLSSVLFLPQPRNCAQPGPSAWDQEDVHGRAKSIRIEEIHYSYTKPQLELKRRVEFDANGNYFEIEEPDMVPRISKGSPPPVFKFDEACRPIERTETVVSEGIVKTTFRYDELGRQIESAGLDENGTLVYREISLYGSNGKLSEQIETIRIHPEHFTPQRYDVYRNAKTEFRYDKKGNRTEEIEFDYTGKYFGKYVKRYDDNNRIIASTCYDSLDRSTKHTVTEYDSDGRVSAREEYQSFTYDSKNNIVPGTIKTDVGSFQLGTRYVLAYDKHGNWNEEKGFEIKETDGARRLTLDSVTYRRISYFG